MWHLFELTANFLLGSAFIGQGISFGKLYLFHVLFTLVFFLGIFNVKDFRESVQGKNLLFVGLLSCLTLFSLVSCLWTSQLKMGLLESTQLLFGCVVIAASCSRRLSYSLFLSKLFPLILMLNALISIVESFGLWRYPISELSQYAELFNKTGMHVSGENFPTGFHWNPNNNAFWILITFPLFLVIEKRKYVRVFYFLLSSWLIFSTHSRFILLAWMMLIVALAAVSLRRASRAVYLGILGFTIILFFYYFMPDRHYNGTFETALGFLGVLWRIIEARVSGASISFNLIEVDWSLHIRAIGIDGLSQVIAQNFFFGAGAGALTGLTHSQAGVSWRLDAPHFYYLEFFAKYGVFAFVTLIYLHIKLLVVSLRTDKYLFLSLAFFVMFNPVLASVSYFLPMWGIMGFIILIKNEQEKNAELIISGRG